MCSEEKSPVEKTSPSTRQRVLRACERCRLKKSRCDGASPCGRCRTYNQTCVLRSHQKPSNKIYPKGYVEMLELEQTMLVAGLQELYRRCVSGEGWTGQSVPALPNGVPLVHEILSRLGTLKQEVKGSPTTTETDLDTFLQTLLSTNTLSYGHKASSDANWDSTNHFSHPLPSNECTMTQRDAMIDLPKQEVLDALATMSSMATSYPQPYTNVFMEQPLQMSFLQPQTGFAHPLPWQIDGIDLSNYMDFTAEGQVLACLPSYPDNLTEGVPLVPAYRAY